jgi:hypothetical protein
MHSLGVDSFLIIIIIKRRSLKTTNTTKHDLTFKKNFFKVSEKKKKPKKHTILHRGHFSLSAATFNPSTIVTEAAEQQHM